MACGGPHCTYKEEVRVKKILEGGPLKGCLGQEEERVKKRVRTIAT